MSSVEHNEVDLPLRVVNSNWGATSSQSVEVLLADAASHLTHLFRELPRGLIIVAPTPTAEDDPITLYRPSAQAPFRILLSARDSYWCQFSYQFSHELCHVLSDYERLKEGLNGWFHETLCELAAIFVVRRMEERWRISPPYAGGSDYADSLATYAEELLSRKERQLPKDMNLSTWLQCEEESLRQDRYQRDKNAVVAYSLLPIFENDPAGWNVIRRLPSSSTMFRDYLSEWQVRAEPTDKAFVKRILNAFA